MDNQTLHEIEHFFAENLQSTYRCINANKINDAREYINSMSEAFTDLALDIHQENNAKAFAPPAD